MGDADQTDVTGLLIELIQNYEFLYDLSHKEYKNAKKKEDAWKEISEITRCSVEDCMKLWKNVRDRFTREKRLKPSGSGGGDTNWVYSEKMSFYSKCTRPRKTHTATVAVVHDGSPSSSRTSSRSSGWSGIETILSPQSEGDIEEIMEQTITPERGAEASGTSSHASETRQSQKGSKSKRSLEFDEVINTAKQIASTLQAKAAAPPPEQNRTFTEYVFTRLMEMPPEEAKEKRKKMLKILEDLD
ncbi:hypothetical protein PPYR_02172 [Photinus pyralis]|uniref:MADF domain-containing protein n=2 Tax=Photinus pyralis TaxID=7054 RepID=A0A1Y1KRQ8_PHOPY|nr:transcription factor Adf-1-like [Photinus pyralis]XP_031327542.1 transcription factor Adf-1-like [Photinus pyralis]KAB0805202.1 hypothetical protein PPYR_02172 [Photinus pyralis]